MNKQMDYNLIRSLLLKHKLMWYPDKGFNYTNSPEALPSMFNFEIKGQVYGTVHFKYESGCFYPYLHVLPLDNNVHKINETDFKRIIETKY